jgi:flagellar hook-length control protein FliK
MISLEAIDGMEAATASARGSEPSITSANRLVQMSDAEHSSPEAITSSSSTSDSSLGNLASGNAAPLTPLSNQTPATPTAHAASVLKTLAPELEKLHQSGQSQMQLDLPVSDTESVKIRLSIRGGELRSTFITESPELREALQKAWPEFAASNRDRGMRFGDTTFQEAAPRNETATDQGRQQRQFQPDNTASNTYRQPSVAPKATPTSAQPTAPTRPGAMNLWA